MNKQNIGFVFFVKRLLYIFLIILVFIIFSFLRCSNKSEQPNSELLDIRLTAFQLYISALIVAADYSNEIETGTNCFEDVGIKPIIIKRGKGPEIVDALVGGSADFGTLAITPIVFQALQGSEFTIFATIQTTNHDIKVIGHHSSGINSGSSLKRKRVGYVGGTFGEIFLDRYLEKHGLQRSDISLVSAGPPQLRDLFISNELDAIIIWEPIIQDILLDEAINRNDVFLDVDTTLYTGRINLVARPQVLEEKQEEAKRLLKALIKGEDLIMKYPDKVRERVENWLDRRPGTLENVFDKETFKVELDVNTLINELRIESEWANEAIFNGRAKIPEDFSKYVNSSLLESVDFKRVKK